MDKPRKYYSVQVTKLMEVCVLAESEEDAEELAISRQDDYDWTRARRCMAEAEELYNDPEDADLIQEFKDEQRFATWD